VYSRVASGVNEASQAANGGRLMKEGPMKFTRMAICGLVLAASMVVTACDKQPVRTPTDGYPGSTSPAPCAGQDREGTGLQHEQLPRPSDC